MVYYLFVNIVLSHIQVIQGVSILLFIFSCFNFTVLLFYCFIADNSFTVLLQIKGITVLLLFYCFIADKRYYCFTVLLQIKGISGGFSLPWPAAGAAAAGQNWQTFQIKTFPQYV